MRTYGQVISKILPHELSVVEINNVLKALPRFPNLLHFPQGIYKMKGDGTVGLIHLVGEQYESILQVMELVFAG